MNRKFTIIFILFVSFNIFSQNKFALVVGNSDYNDLTSLKNPENDALDISSALKSIGFDVNLLTNADSINIENAIIKLSDDLSKNSNSIGLFYFAGHGVQVDGLNYLIPSNTNITNEAFLRQRAVSTQAVLDILKDAQNELNIVILDACRDNPFSWKRGGNRGLSVVSNQPAGSIIVYATAAGQTASDGDRRNGLFTQELLKNITTEGLSINEIFRRTGIGVSDASNGKQLPAIYSQYYGLHTLTDKNSNKIEIKDSETDSIISKSETIENESSIEVEIDKKVDYFSDISLYLNSTKTRKQVNLSIGGGIVLPNSKSLPQYEANLTTIASEDIKWELQPSPLLDVKIGYQFNSFLGFDLGMKSYFLRNYFESYMHSYNDVTLVLDPNLSVLLGNKDKIGLSVGVGYSLATFLLSNSTYTYGVLFESEYYNYDMINFYQDKFSIDFSIYYRMFYMAANYKQISILENYHDIPDYVDNITNNFTISFGYSFPLFKISN